MVIMYLLDCMRLKNLSECKNIIITNIQMQNSKLIGGINIIFDNYDITLVSVDDKKLDFYIRDTFKNQIYEAKAYELSKLNFKAVETGLRKSRKDITAEFIETSCQEQGILEIKVSVEVMLLPKTTEIIYVPKVKKLKQQEIFNAKLFEIKKKILESKEIIDAANKTFSKKVYISKSEAISNNASGAKEQLGRITLNKGKYLITISGLMKTNASNYVSPALSKADICPGTYHGTPTQAQTNPLAYLVRAIVDVSSENESIEYTATNGHCYGFTLYNFLMTAEKLSQ